MVLLLNCGLDSFLQKPNWQLNVIRLFQDEVEQVLKILTYLILMLQKHLMSIPAVRFGKCFSLQLLSHFPFIHGLSESLLYLHRFAWSTFRNFVHLYGHDGMTLLRISSLSIFAISQKFFFKYACHSFRSKLNGMLSFL